MKTIIRKRIIPAVAALLLSASVFIAMGTEAAAASKQKSFATPEQAVDAVRQACEKGKTKTLLEIFGPEGKDIVESGDRSDDRQNRTQFVKLLREKHALIADPANPDKMILSIGDEDWPFPVPLVREGGSWHFDSPSGRQEILARRIGANEMSAIEICHGFVEAQFEYAQNHRHKDVPEYAQQIVSSPGKQDGIYWEPAQGFPDPDVPKGFARAAATMARDQREPYPEPYHGYFFKVLKAQGSDARGGAIQYVQDGAMIGGFALVGWPADYGVSGVQSFIVNNDGTVYEKDAGPDTTKTAEGMTEFNPDKTWHTVQP